MTERELWRVRNGAREAAKVLDKYSEFDTIQKWQRRLPFPLASILQIYDATLDVYRRCDILFGFFEATAELLTTLLLSGLRSDLDAYKDLKSRGVISIEHSSWSRATLGSWVTSGSSLAKSVRKLLSGDAEQAGMCRSLFGISGDWIESLSSKELFVALDRVIDLRNSWKAHGGIADDREAAQRLERLQSELTLLLGPLSRVFESVSLIRPRSFGFDGEVFEGVAEELMDAAVPFREISIKVTKPLVSGSLYLHERESRGALEVLPLVQMRAGPPSPTACYFYNRLDADGARFVSFHQVADAEIMDLDPNLSSLIHELSTADDG